MYSGAKKYCQPPIVHVLPLKKMREAGYFKKLLKRINYV